MRVGSAHSTDRTMLLEDHIPILPGVEGMENVSPLSTPGAAVPPS